MAKNGLPTLPPVAAVFSLLLLLFPARLPAELVAGSAVDCVNLFDTEFSSYLAVEDSYTDSGCFRNQGTVYVSREGLSGSSVVRFYAIADNKQCWVQDEITVVGDIYELSGHDTAAWKKYLLNEGCDRVNGGALEQRVVFVTSLMFTGDLVGAAKSLGLKGRIRSGLEAADKICTRLANDAGLPGDTYTAWLSDSTASAGDRVVHSEVPYMLVDGQQIADSYATLITVGTDCATQPCLDRAIRKNQYGQEVPYGSTQVWTSTYASGVGIPPNATADACQDWTATTSKTHWGAAEFRHRGWTDMGSERSCSENSRLYCFQD